MKSQVDNASAFCLVADETIDRLAEKKFFGIRTNAEATDRLKQELRKVKDQVKLAEKMVKNVDACVVMKNALGLPAYLPKVETCFRDLTALSIETAALLHKWGDREKNK